MKRIVAVLVTFLILMLWVLARPQSEVNALVGALVISWILIPTLVRMPVTKFLPEPQLHKPSLINWLNHLIRNVDGVTYHFEKGVTITGKLVDRSDAHGGIGIKHTLKKEEDQEETAVSYFSLNLERVVIPDRCLKNRG